MLLIIYFLNDNSTNGKNVECLKPLVTCKSNSAIMVITFHKRIALKKWLQSKKIFAVVAKVFIFENLSETVRKNKKIWL